MPVLNNISSRSAAGNYTGHGPGALGPNDYRGDSRSLSAVPVGSMTMATGHSAGGVTNFNPATDNPASFGGSPGTTGGTGVPWYNDPFGMMPPPSDAGTSGPPIMPGDPFYPSSAPYQVTPISPSYSPWGGSGAPTVQIPGGFGTVPYADYTGTPTLLPTQWTYDSDLGSIPRALPANVPTSTTGYVPGAVGTGAPYYNPFAPASGANSPFAGSPFGLTPSGSVIPWGETKGQALLSMAASKQYSAAPSAWIDPTVRDSFNPSPGATNSSHFLTSMAGGGGGGAVRILTAPYHQY